jgi:hypothetical protein
MCDGRSATCKAQRATSNAIIRSPLLLTLWWSHLKITTLRRTRGSNATTSSAANVRCSSAAAVALRFSESFLPRLYTRCTVHRRPSVAGRRTRRGYRHRLRVHDEVRRRFRRVDQRLHVAVRFSCQGRHQRCCRRHVVASSMRVHVSDVDPCSMFHDAEHHLEKTVADSIHSIRRKLETAKAESRPTDASGFQGRRLCRYELVDRYWTRRRHSVVHDSGFRSVQPDHQSYCRGSVARFRMVQRVVADVDRHRRRAAN